MERTELVPHLFRTEYSKITAVLCKRFGFSQIEIAEDIASETFLSAIESWSYKGIPENPTAWLYTVAGNKAKNRLHREQLFAQRISPQLSKDPVVESMSLDVSESNIIDSQLRMIFAICSPSIPDESQIGLALRILCGFGIDEIANAFLTNKETINKRLFRAREKLREQKIEFEFPPEIKTRLENVLRTLYLLFNEGYYSESVDAVIREDLCHEAIRLTKILLQSEKTSLPKVHALLALMCFQASRLKARRNAMGQMILYENQDESLWDRDLILLGGWHLHRSSQGTELSKYHIEASIAYWHTIKTDTKEKWNNILRLYDHLMDIDPSPVTALNRMVAFSKVHGSRSAIEYTLNLNVEHNHFYYALLGELYRDTDREEALINFQKAFAIAKTSVDKQTLTNRIQSLYLGVV